MLTWTLSYVHVQNIRTQKSFYKEALLVDVCKGVIGGRLSESKVIYFLVCPRRKAFYAVVLNAN